MQAKEARWWCTHYDRVICEACPRRCSLGEGQRGFCFVRKNTGGALELTTYGRSTGFCIDPIEKKPLNHFLPGSAVLSFGTAGCNLGCKFCQNWDISKSRELDIACAEAAPEEIAEAALAHGCGSIAFTYNDPVTWAEYAIDTAIAAHERGIKTVAVTAGYMSPQAREEFFSHIDAANVDLKAFSEDFYRKLTFGSLAPVLDTLKYLRNETPVWLEITTLLIPGENDTPEETAQMCAWIAQNLGPDVPLHFTAFHPDYKLLDRPATPQATLIRARAQALDAGLRYVYLGNVLDAKRQSTYCPGCGCLVIERNHYQLGKFAVQDGCCTQCGTKIAGVFANEKGSWGSRRMPVRLGAG